MKKKTPNAILWNVTGEWLLAGRVAAAIAVAVVAVSLAYEIVLRPQAEFNTQYQRFMSSDVVPKIVFIGDSRLVWGLHHGAMDRNFFNYTQFGDAPTVRSSRPPRHA